MSELLLWSDIRVGTWGDNPFIWSDVSLVEELIQTSSGNVATALDLVKKFPKAKRKQLIKILLTLRGIDFYSEKYKNDSKINITLSDIQFLFENKDRIKPIVNIKVKED